MHSLIKKYSAWTTPILVYFTLSIYQNSVEPITLIEAGKKTIRKFVIYQLKFNSDNFKTNEGLS